MLRELHIKNIAVIEETSVEFNEGFQALTGETGAGKSILIDSIGMALGGRTSRELIRTGADWAAVDTAFEIDNEETVKNLSELGIDCEDGTVVISRKIYADGKSKCHINGRLTPLNVVREAGALLLTIHGQNDNQSILSPKTHIKFVDEYGNNDALLEEYRKQFSAVREIKTSLAALESDEREKDKLIELLTFQTEEISAAKLKSGEEEELEERRSLLQNAEEISDAAQGAYYALQGSDEGGGACDYVAEALRKLEAAKDFAPKLSECYDTLSSVMADMDDAKHELYVFADGVEYDRAELDNIESRLSLIFNLKRKYGATVDDILEYGEKSAERLAAIQKSDERRAELKAELEEQLGILSEIAARLTSARVEAALKLQESIMNELADLDMQKMRFSAEIGHLTEADGSTRYTADGCDSVEFLISANPGEALKPLSKIASGGEMSRIMLAIKSVLSDTDSVETMIFDEIDTGVSGRAAQKIAEKMGKLAKVRQILCITHLAQIAAMADDQYLIEKNTEGDKTSTTVSSVTGEARRVELARIIGGVKVTELTLNAAQEMLDMAEEYKRG
ncbi:MAG: DNA repair protein RecN [Clostridia bacterium]|nr:DNA repair protein RecN [Clostridia bacterium]